MSFKVSYPSIDSKSELSDKTKSPSEQFNSHLNNHIVTKGGHELVKIDLNEIDDIVELFRNKPDELIRTLEGETAKRFQEMASYASILHGTESYDLLIERVNRQFADLDEVRPGTVGAYFHGCFVETSFSKTHPGCSVTCAGSMPPSKSDEHFKHCGNTVVSAQFVGSSKNKNKGHYNFEILNKSNKHNKKDLAYLYIPYTSIHRCPGFSKKEISQLSSMGIKYVRLVGYKKDSTKYYDLAPKPIKVSHLKSRVDEIKPKHIKVKNDEKNIWIGTVIVVTIIIILMILWYLQSKSLNHT